MEGLRETSAICRLVGLKISSTLDTSRFAPSAKGTSRIIFNSRPRTDCYTGGLLVSGTAHLCRNGLSTDTGHKEDRDDRSFSKYILPFCRLSNSTLCHWPRLAEASLAGGPTEPQDCRAPSSIQKDSVCSTRSWSFSTNQARPPLRTLGNPSRFVRKV